jgi:hypothetical protein
VLTGRERPYLEADLQLPPPGLRRPGQPGRRRAGHGRGETASAGQKVEAAQRDATQRLLPDATLQVDRVRAMDAKVKYRADWRERAQPAAEEGQLDLTWTRAC